MINNSARNVTLLSNAVSTVAAPPGAVTAGRLMFGILELYSGMKTAISLPDALFKSGDALAKRLGLSRSELYARALAEYVAKHKGSSLTQRLNAVYADEDSRMDPAMMSAQLRALSRDPW